VRDIAGDGFIAQQCNAVLVVPIAIARSRIRSGTRQSGVPIGRRLTVII
jgi:hypothetical protein